MKPLRCPVCSCESNSFVQCDKVGVPICWRHCKSCTFYEPIFHGCLWKPQDRVAVLKEKWKNQQGKQSSET
ncbi:MAG: hypothetical protein LKG17_07610 [Megasphaera sp.]|nr:hypothetical protein [Megasphaera sp.]